LCHENSGSVWNVNGHDNVDFWSWQNRSAAVIAVVTYNAVQ